MEATATVAPDAVSIGRGKRLLNAVFFLREKKAQMNVIERFFHLLWRIVQVAILAFAGIVLIGPINERFQATLKDEALGTAYFEAKKKVFAVSSATTFQDLKQRSAELAVWSEGKGMEFLSLKKNSQEAAFALRHAKNEIGASLAQTLENEADREFLVYRIRKAANDVPLDAFRKNAPDVWKLGAYWTLTFVLVCSLASLFVALIGSYLRGDNLPRKIASVSGCLIGGAIGGGILGWIVAQGTISGML